MKSLIPASTIMILLFSLIGCSSKLIVTPVMVYPEGEGKNIKDSEINPYMEETGIYFGLPKTSINIEVPVAVSGTFTGKYFDIFDDCYNSCIGRQSGSESKCKNANEIDDYKIQIQKVSIKSNIERDDKHLYRINVDRDWLSEMSHLVKLTSQGILVSSDYTVENKTAEIGVELLKVAGSIAPFIFLSVPTIERDATSDQETIINNEMCKEVEAWHDLLAEKEKWEKTEEVSRLIGDIQSLKNDKNLYIRNKQIPADVGILEKVISSYNSEISKKNDELEKLYSRKFDKEKIEKIGNAERAKDRFFYGPIKYLLKAKIEPEDFKALESQTGSWEMYELVEVDVGDDKSIRQELVTEGNEYRKRLIDSKDGLKYQLSPTIPFIFTPNQINHSRREELNSRALRYRIPAKGELKISMGNTLYYKTEIDVAQYGPLASVPEKIGGIKKSINLSLHPNTGGIDSISIGSTPVSTSTLKDASQVAADLLKDHKGKDIKDLEEKENRLELEKNILTYEKEIKELKVD